MRFISAIRWKRSCQVAHSGFFAANFSRENISGNGNYCGHRLRAKAGSRKRQDLCHSVREGTHFGGVKNSIRASRRIMTGAAEITPGKCWIDYSRQTWGVGEQCTHFWSRFRWWCRPNIPTVLCDAKRAHSKAPYAASPWRPAVLVVLFDNKGQVVLRSLGLALGGAYSSATVPAPLAEQFEGKFALNSLNREPHSSYGRSAAALWKTVEAMSLVFRAIYLLGLFMPCFILAPFADTVAGPVRTYWLGLLLKTLERAGPAFIKWGQWAATRPDVFPQDVCDSLSTLHMQAPSHSFQQTRTICERAFRVQLEELFEEFSEDPVASGSIAQVHRAILKGQGKSSSSPKYVAVKVRHPDVSRVIQRDFVIIKWLANVSTILPGLRELHLEKTVQQFASFMTKQVDLTLEAAHLLRFIYNFRKSKDVSFPVPIYPWVHPAVLVETYEEGQSIANFVDLTTGPTRTHSQLAYIGSSALLKMLLKDNFIHGDLHPGNIFVRFVGNSPKVIILDVGITAELNQRSRDILLELFKAVAEKDGLRAAQWTLKFSENQNCPDPEGFARDVDTKFKEYLIQRGTSQNTGECMNELFDQVRKHRVNMDGDVCTVMVTTLVLEGWQRKLDPGLDIIKMVGDLLFRQDWAIPYNYILRAIVAP